MRKLLLIEDTIPNKISYYQLACFLVALPFDFFYSEIILISFGLHTLIHVRRTSFGNIWRKPVIVLTSLYLLGLVAILYSSDKQEGINVLTKQLAILGIPVLFALTNLDLEKYKMNLLCIFAFACTVTILYLYADAIYTIFYFHLPLSSLFMLTFMNHNFSLPIELHATYMSLYTVFSLLFFIYLLLTGKVLRRKWIYVISILILGAGMMQLASRAVFIAFLLIINLVLPFFFQEKKRLAIFLTASIISAITVMMISSMDSFKTRYISELKTDLTKEARMIENTEPRLARWNAITELVKKSPLLGYGTGSEKKLLKEKYFEKGLYISYLNEFNTHSEYLSILIKTGVIGLALFMCVLYFGFVAAIRKKDFIFLSFMVILTVVSVSENILDLNKGIFFYSIFFSLFLWQGKTGNGPEAGILGAKQAT